jgi:hypothetical protein
VNNPTLKAKIIEMILIIINLLFFLKIPTIKVKRKEIKNNPIRKKQKIISFMLVHLNVKGCL